jgi:23S rRNA (pseudouridine1915-N3)-methyltransferase
VKITVVAVGSPARLLEGSIREYEERASRYWKLHTVTVDAETTSKGRPVEEVMAAEAERLQAAVPEGTEVLALTRKGKGFTSSGLAKYLNRLAVRGAAGVTFVIGGAHGLDPTFLARADRRITLSTMTLPHDLARLVLAEQLYRAGTIVRGEPYHKGS